MRKQLKHGIDNVCVCALQKRFSLGSYWFITKVKLFKNDFFLIIPTPFRCGGVRQVIRFVLWCGIELTLMSFKIKYCFHPHAQRKLTQWTFLPPQPHLRPVIMYTIHVLTIKTKKTPFHLDHSGHKIFITFWPILL